MRIVKKRNKTFILKFEQNFLSYYSAKLVFPVMLKKKNNNMVTRTQLSASKKPLELSFTSSLFTFFHMFH
jgi:hypothetical protein